MKLNINYDWKTYNLVLFGWGPLFFGAIWVTIFYYGFFFWLSNVLFDGLNYYIQGILAGIAGGVWGYAINKGYKLQNKTEAEIDTYSHSTYENLRKKHMNRTLLFFFLIIVEIAIIKFLGLY
jgi:hypothetical protein